MTTSDFIVKPQKAEAFPATLRYYTVSCVSNYPKYDKIPAIMLRGRWLEKAGFASGRKIEVRVMNECLVITARSAPSGLEKALQRITQFPAYKQKQIMALIAMVENSKNTAD